MEALLNDGCFGKCPRTMPASTLEEMTEVELEVANRFKGEKGKCSFLRSAAFQKLRRMALYGEDDEGFSVYHNGLKMTLENKEVTVEWVEPAYDPEREAGKRKFASQCSD